MVGRLTAANQSGVVFAGIREQFPNDPKPL
jgi:hypothetical protein